MRTKGLAIGLALASASLSGARASTNLLINGSFETGDFTGWTLSGNIVDTMVEGPLNGVDPEDGNFQAVTGAVGSLNLISQTFSDVSDATYEVSLWEASEGGSPSEFDVAINGTDLSTLVPSQRPDTRNLPLHSQEPDRIRFRSATGMTRIFSSSTMFQ